MIKIVQKLRKVSNQGLLKCNHSSINACHHWSHNCRKDFRRFYSNNKSCKCNKMTHLSVIGHQIKKYFFTLPHPHLYCKNLILNKNFCTQTKLSFVHKELYKYLEGLIVEKDHVSKLVESEQIPLEEKQKLNKKLEQLQPVMRLANIIQTKREELSELKKLFEDEKTNKDLLALASKDIEDCEIKLKCLENEIFQVLLPESHIDDKNIMLEVKPGVGGQEAMLFAKEIFEMYINFASWNKWELQLLEFDPNEIGGLRHGNALIFGSKVYKYLKFEGGVHRVQRVPITEKSGRIHTSTVTVAVMPQPEEIDIKLNPADIKTETTRSSGKGGQHVNTTDTCVRVVHLPTGIFAECQQERSQIKNKELALKTLYTRIYQKKLDDQMEKLHSNRKMQVGTSGRSEKIRTYNFNQDRITDHRTGHSVFNLPRFLNGGEELHNMIEHLLQEERNEMLMEFFQTRKK